MAGPGKVKLKHLNAIGKVTGHVLVVQADGTVGAEVAPSGGVPTGVFFPFAGLVSAVPSGYLPCDGSAVNRTTYAALFTALGTVWGVGDGSTTFNLPDMRGKVPGGINDGTLPNGQNGGLTGRALAATAGVESIGNHQHTYSGTSGSPNPLGGGGTIGGGTVSHTHTHSISGTTVAAGAASVIQPTAYCPYIIKT